MDVNTLNERVSVSFACYSTFTILHSTVVKACASFQTDAGRSRSSMQLLSVTVSVYVIVFVCCVLLIL